MMIQESGEMYLETILILKKNKTEVRSVDIGEYMGFSKPSVSRAVNNLKKGGYIEIGEKGAIELTEAGQQLAAKIYERHNTLTSVLVGLGVDEKTAVVDACRIEHVISDASFEAIKKYMGRL